MSDLTTATAAVRGSATVTVEADYAVLHLTVRHQRRDREEAVARATADVAVARELLAGFAGRRSGYMSGLRVRRERFYDNATQTMVDGDWTVEANGEARIDRDAVAAAAASVVASTVSLDGIGWCLDDTNPAYRQARKDAVADARRAAADFAEGAEMQLGPLVSLADPGLLDAGVAAQAKYRGDAMTMATMDAPGGGEGDDLTVEPPRLTVGATVEAVYRLLPA